MTTNSEHERGPGTGSYADAGVDLEAAERSVDLIRAAVAGAQRPEVLGGIGGFGGLFAFDPSPYREPVLVSSTDGAGTKVDLARRLDALDTIGQDLVAMVVNDLVVAGAQPLFFNDYLVMGKLDPDRVARIVGGIADGCRLAGCALNGGETAEHPGLLGDDEFDLAGFGVGVVERSRMLGPNLVRPGDELVALGSSGVHSNGFSLIRRLVDHLDLEQSHGLDRALGAELMTPTRIYVRDCLALADEVELHALCHVTGGGIPGNLPRVLPEGLGAGVDATTWERPPVFDLLQSLGPVADDEMWRTFNLGVGMLAVVAAGAGDQAVALLTERGVPAWVLGAVEEGDQVRISRAVPGDGAGVTR